MLTDGRTDGRKVITIAHPEHSSGELKILVSYFFMRNPYMKFQNSSMHSSTYAMHQKVCNTKMPKVIKGHNSRIIFQNLFKS